MIPSQSGDGGMPGEKKVFNLLREALNDKYIVYYNLSLPINTPSANPDFIIIDDDLGVIVLEVKDYKKETILGGNPNNLIIKTDNGEKSVKNPFLQAKGYAEAINNILEKNDSLVNREGIYKGRLKFPYGYAVIFPYLRIRDSDQMGLDRVIPKNCLFLAEDTRYASESFSYRAFLRRLRRTRRVSFDFDLSYEDINTIRGILCPEIRIENPLSDTSDNRIIKTLDAKQEQYAKSIGQGHQLIRGVSGSGKTVILIARAAYLRKIHPDWRILIVTYNRSLTRWIKESLEEKIPFSDIDVFGFHQLCRKLLVEVDLWNEISDLKDKQVFWDDILPNKALKEIENKNIRTPRYEAILIDEEQDFSKSWLGLLLHLLDERTDELFIVMDQAQKIYQRGFTWKSAGIRVAGRTKILEISYRTTHEIVKDAHDFIKKDDILFKELKIEGESYIDPENTVRHGDQPEIITCNNFYEKCKNIGDKISNFLKAGYKRSDIFVLSRSKNSCQSINAFLNNRGIFSEFITKFDNWDPKKDSVKCLTMHSSKGLENEIVICDTGKMLQDLSSEGKSKEDISKERRLLYVAMTRAMNFLIIFYDRNALSSPEKNDVSKKASEAINYKNDPFT